MWYERVHGEEGRGGTITNRNNAELTIRNSNFRENAGHRGGAVANRGTLDVAGSNFYSNTAQYGGAINDLRSKPSTAVIDNSEFHGNFAGVGGAISNSSGDVPQLRVQRGTFRDNEAKFGGALFTNAGGIDVSSGKFIKNSADREGGAGYIDCPRNNRPNSYIGVTEDVEFSENSPNDIFNLVIKTLEDSRYLITDAQKLSDNCARGASEVEV